MPDLIRTPVDDIPLEVRRLNWGWWGDPWPSDVCYDDDGSTRWNMRKPFPEGEDCLYCTERFQPGDSGQAMPLMTAAGGPQVRHAHKECLLREVLGPLAHLQGRCRCQGGSTVTPGLNLRQDALAVWDWARSTAWPIIRANPDEWSRDG